MADDLIVQDKKLHEAADSMLQNSVLMPLLSSLGTVIPRGSFTTGLMTYPDLDFAVQNKNPDINDARKLIPAFFDELNVHEFKLTDFSENKNETASYFVGLKFMYEDLEWQIAATVGLPGPLKTEVDDWLERMTSAQRKIILRLKTELKNAGRYGSSLAVPPYTFRAVQLYEGVLKGGATNIPELEQYFDSKK